MQSTLPLDPPNHPLKPILILLIQCFTCSFCSLSSSFTCSFCSLSSSLLVFSVGTLTGRCRLEVCILLLLQVADLPLLVLTLGSGRRFCEHRGDFRGAMVDLGHYFRSILAAFVCGGGGFIPGVGQGEVSGPNPKHCEVIAMSSSSASSLP